MFFIENHSVEDVFKQVSKQIVCAKARQTGWFSAYISLVSSSRLDVNDLNTEAVDLYLILTLVPW